MSQIVLKRFRNDEMVAISVVFLLGLVLVEGLIISILKENRDRSPELLFYLIIMLLWALFLGGIMSWFVLEFRKRIYITENSVVYSSGKK